jgi:P27 family predicted phage terminase small subunit
MRRGTKPKSTAQRKLEGNPGRRPFNPHEPELPPPPDDTPPLELVDDRVATAEWARLLPLLRRAHAITEGDRGSLLALCQQWSRYLTAHNHVASSGMVVRSPSGYPMPNPYIGIANKALGNCMKLWAELGLTPSARSRVTTTPGVGGGFDDAFSEFDDPLPPTKPH